MSTLFFREVRYFVLAVLMILVVGTFSVLSIGRQEDPTITNLFATILTPYPGASPARVESLVTEKIEQELREIEEIDEITSTSRTGISVIQVQLSEFISDAEIERTWSEIRDAIGDAEPQLPDGVPTPEFDNDRVGAYTLISAISARPGRDVPPSVLTRYGELLQDRLRGVGGTELVKVFGDQVEEVRVTVNPDVLISLGLSMDDVSTAIARADSKSSAGRVRGAESDYLIEVTGEIEDLDRLRNVPIRTADNLTTKLSDIAEVERTIQTPSSTLARADGKEAVVVAARMQSDLQVDVWADRSEAALAEFEALLPDGLQHELLFNQARYTVDRLTDLGINILIGVSLIISVLLVTLGWRAAVVVSVVLPLASLLSIAVLQRLGIPIHQMSVTGLIVALGLLVDAAIVMTDEIRRRLLDGEETVDAVGQAVKRLAMPLLASTLTTVLAFMPMAVLPGPAGDFVGSIAIAVIVMLSASFLLALTLTPAFAGFMLPRGSALEGGSRAWWQTGIELPRLGALFRQSLDWSLSNPKLSILAAAALPVIGFLSFPTLTAQFFPGVDRDQFYIQVTLPQGTAISETYATSRRADALIRAEDGIEQVHWFVGESAPAFYYNMLANQDGVPGFAEALITTESKAATRTLVPLLQTRLDTALPEAQVLVRDLVQGPPVNAPVEVRLVGPELGMLRDLGEELRLRLTQIPEVTHTKASLMGGAPKLQFNMDEDLVRQAGLSLDGVARQLDSALEGATGGSLVEGSEELPVRVRAGDSDRATAADVRGLSILSPSAPTGARVPQWPGVPLSALGTVALVPSDSSIARKDGERVNTVQAYIQLGVLPEEVLKQVQDDLAANPPALPPGYRIEYGGDSDARADVLTNLLSSMGLIIALLVATIVLTFNSFRLSGIAILVTVLSIGLSILALAIFRYPFGINAVIGVIGSIGVSINAAIIIMTGLQANPKAMTGDISAIRDTVTASSRHITSTTITTFGGFLPLILAGGGFWPPFAMAIAGGVLLSTVVSFYFVPPMFKLALAIKPQDQEKTLGFQSPNLAQAAE